MALLRRWSMMYSWSPPRCVIFASSVIDLRTKHCCAPLLLTIIVSSYNQSELRSIELGTSFQDVKCQESVDDCCPREIQEILLLLACSTRTIFVRRIPECTPSHQCIRRYGCALCFNVLSLLQRECPAKAYPRIEDRAVTKAESVSEHSHSLRLN